MSRLVAGRYDPNSGQWRHTSCPIKNIQKEELTVATYNMWFGDYYAYERFSALMAILQACDADVIALQEATKATLNAILKQDWVRGDYFCSDMDCRTFESYGVVLLSRIPIQFFEIHDLPGQMDRKLLLGQFLINGEKVSVGTVHLESLQESATRKRQLELIIPLLEGSPHSILMGDFNFCATCKEENEILEKNFEDTWTILKQGEAGYTRDTKINLMVHSLGREEKRARIDRILFNTGSQNAKLVPHSIELLGAAAISKTLPMIFPSDHFGLSAKFKLSF